MSDRPWWVAELAVAAAALGLGLLLGFAGATSGAAISAVFGALFAWHALQATRYLDWLRGEVDASNRLPGIWRLLSREHDQALRRSRNRWRREHRYQKRLSAAVAVLPDAVVILDPQQRVEWCSPQALALLGIDLSTASGRLLNELVPVPELGAMLEREATGEPHRVRSPLDPAVMLSLRMVALPKRKRPRRVLLACDVTTLHNLDRVRQDFIANVSHELRTPLTVLRGFLESLDSDGGTPAEWGSAIVTMLAQARRMQSLTEDLLTLSRLEMGAPEPDEETVDVPGLLGDLVGEAHSISGVASHVITLDIDRSLHLQGVTRELHSAVANLVVNAVLHTPPRCRIRIVWAADGDGARLTVRDTGEGIAADHLARLTERFYRVDPSRSRASGGTGLGLAIVKHVLLRHDSTLEVTSKVGIGTTFSCRFPVARVRRAPQPGVAVADVGAA